MHLYLAICSAVAVQQGSPGPSCYGLTRLLHHGGDPVRQPETIAELLALRYGVARQVDWPLAPLLLNALGHDAGDGWWLAADPVTLVAGRIDVRLGGRAEQIGSDDAAALVARLNAHFAGDGLEFVAARPDRWFVRAPRPMALATIALSRALGRSLRELQPQGADSGLWLRWRSEIEMLLHEDPVNVERERRGQRSMNSIWLSGGGRLPSSDRTRTVPVTFTDDELVAALARHAGAPFAPLPTQFGGARDLPPRASERVIAIATQRGLDEIERCWTGPVWGALRRGELAAVTVMIDDGASTRSWTVHRPRWLARAASRFGAPDLATLLAQDAEAP